MPNRPPRNPYLCLAIAVGLIVTTLVATVCIAWLEFAGRPASTALAMIVSGAIGALAGRFGDPEHGIPVPRQDNGSPPPSKDGH